MKRLFIAALVFVGFGACSSSTNVCQQTLATYDVGDCDLALDSGILAELTINQAQRSVCETACTSSTDQTAVTNLLTCLNYIPADAGACSLDGGGESHWLTQVVGQALVCFDTNMPSTGCYNAIVDAG